ncbi:MAG: hypothetical protein DMG07_08895 [Acidobacteria bacterium]|nr:MAG: hypothetical protein DMG07_08895 [Acidobacteriota bacterium]
MTEPALDAIDFPNSFLTFNRLDQNIARIQLDARCQYAPRKDAPAREYFLITPCKSERMYVREDLWQDPNHDYRGFYSETEHMTLKIYPSADRDRRYAQLNSQRFVAMKLDIRRASRSRRLGTDSEIREAVIAGEKLVARHKIIDEATGGWAVLEYPVKTISVHPSETRWQVDTGPVGVPEFGARVGLDVERLRVAYVAYNRFEHVEFLVRCPTPIAVDGRTVAATSHYSRVEKFRGDWGEMLAVDGE